LTEWSGCVDVYHPGHAARSTSVTSRLERRSRTVGRDGLARMAASIRGHSRRRQVMVQRQIYSSRGRGV